MMYGPLIVEALLTANASGIVCWFVARRLRAVPALVLPLLALATFIGLILWSGDRQADHGFGLLVAVAAFAGPSLIGAGLGIWLSVLQRRRRSGGDS